MWLLPKLPTVQEWIAIVEYICVMERITFVWYYKKINLFIFGPNRRTIKPLKTDFEGDASQGPCDTLCCSFLSKMLYLIACIQLQNNKKKIRLRGEELIYFCLVSRSRCPAKAPPCQVRLWRLLPSSSPGLWSWPAPTSSCWTKTTSVILCPTSPKNLPPGDHTRSPAASPNFYLLFFQEEQSL